MILADASDISVHLSLLLEFLLAALSVLLLIGPWIIRAIMLIVVPRRRDPSAALAWLSSIFLFPWIGLLIYLLIGSTKVSRRRREQYRFFMKRLSELGEHYQEFIHLSQPSLDARMEQIATLTRNLGVMPALGGNTVELLPDYDGVIERLVADIDTAEQHVHMVYFAFVDDETGVRVIEALSRAVARGVVCRVLLDAVGSKQTVRRIIPKLRGLGVDAHVAYPFRLFGEHATRFDLRNHRKITVVDARVAYTGSLNLVNATYNRKDDIVYEELVARVTGPIVLALQTTFIGDWYYETHDFLNSEEDIFPEPVITGAVVAQALPSGPDYERGNIVRLFASLLYSARERAVLTTPYFIPDEALLSAIETAALRGVEVHLVVSRQEDQFLVSQAQQSFYVELLEAGVRIHRYIPKFLHSKHLTIDEDIALIGSSNMDKRSLELNNEISLLVYDRDIVAELRAHEEGYFQNAEQLRLEDWEQRPLPRKVVQNTARLASPLL